MAAMLKKNIFIPLLLFCSVSARLCACDVPVFRYALERWPAATYNLTMFTGGSLGADETGAVNRCRELFSAQERAANLRLLVDHTETDQPNRLVLSLEFTGDQLAHIWSGRLTEANARRVAQSPAREEIADRLLGGQTAVWVLLECGDKDLDRAAEKLLSSELKKLEKNTYAAALYGLVSLVYVRILTI